MSSYPSSKHSHAKLIVIIISGLLILGAAGVGTVTLLSKLHVKSFPQQQSDSSTQQTTHTPTALKDAADQEFAKNDYQAALRDYKSAAEAYKTAGDTANAMDVAVQVSIVEKTIAINNTTGKTKPSNLGVASSTK